MFQKKHSLWLFAVLAISLTLLTADSPLYRTFTSGTGVISVDLRITRIVFHSVPPGTVAFKEIFYALLFAGVLAAAGLLTGVRPVLQLRLTAFNFLFILLAIFYSINKIYRLHSVDKGTLSDGMPAYGVLLLLMLPVFNYLAVRGIQKQMKMSLKKPQT